MNFLKKAQDQANKNAGGTAQKLPPVGSKPAVPGVKPAVPGAKPNIPSRPVAPGAKPNIPSRPVAPGAKPAAPTTPKVEEEKGPIAKSSNPFKLGAKKAEEVKPEVETKEVATAPVEETTATTTEAITEETSVNEPIVAEEPKKEEPKKEETKKASSKKTSNKKTSNKKTTTKKEEPVDTPDVEEAEEIVIPTTDCSYSDAVLAIRSTFFDEEWEAFKEDTSNRLSEIHISNDMTPSALNQTISDLNALRDSIWQHYLESKTFFETLTAKDDGLIDRTKRLNSKGANENERKLNSTMALMNHKIDGKNINLYEVLDASRARYNYTKELMESIKYKSNAVITMLGNLKLEK